MSRTPGQSPCSRRGEQPWCSPASASAIAELLLQAAAEDGQTVICATHDPEVMRAADEILALGE